MNKHFIAVDIGASSGRLLLGKWDGKHFELSEVWRFPNESVRVHGHMYWDVLRLWHEIKQGLLHYRKTHSEALAGISVDTWGVDFALLDSAGNLLGNPYHYRDHRTDGFVEKGFGYLAKAATYAITGIQFMQINTLYQLLSMVETQHPQLAQAQTLLMMPDLFHYWLSGEKYVEYTDASTSQMLDAKTRNWANSMLEGFAIPSHILPPIIPPGTIIGSLQPELKSELGFTEEVPIIATGSHDTANAVAAIPHLDKHSVYISSGTWSLMGIEVTEPILSEAALAYNFTNEGGVMGTIRFLKNVMGLWLLQESRRQWQREGQDYSWEELLDLAEKAEPFQALIDPDAKDFLGHGDMPASIRNYCRRTGQNEPKDVGSIIRCCLESLALRYRWVIEALEQLSQESLNSIRIVGGGSQNALLNQFTADACKRPVISGPIEATALGNIMMQAIASGDIKSLEEGRKAIAASVSQQSFQPQASQDWDKAFTKFKALVDS